MVITEEKRDELIAAAKEWGSEDLMAGYISTQAGKDIAALCRIALAALTAPVVADVVEWSHPSEERKCSVNLRRFDLPPGPLFTVQPVPVLHLPPPITEEDGYLLNTSWHAGAIFRDGANWMLDQAKQMQPPLAIRLPDTGSKAFWHGSGKTEVFLPTAYKRWVKEAIERDCTIARINVEVK